MTSETVSVGQRLLWSIRATILHGLALAADRPLLRLVLDRWPTAAERRCFRRALRHSVTPVPPLLRGFAAVPDARAPLTRAMLLSWLIADESYRGPTREGLGSESPPGDHLRIWTRPSVSFLHFERTAGTALTSWLAMQFHPAQIDPDPYRSMPPHIYSPLAPDAGRRFGGYALVHGHYDLPALRRLARERAVVVMLREPRARISLYYFWRSIDPALLGAAGENRNVRHAHEVGLLEFLSLDDPFIVDYIDNLYVRRLTGSYASAGTGDPLRLRPDETVEAAYAALGTVDVVGITERMRDSVVSFDRLFGTSGSEAPPRLNDALGNRRDRPESSGRWSGSRTRRRSRLRSIG